MVTDPAPAPQPAPRPLYTARVQNIAGTAGQVRVRDASAVELGTAAPGADRAGGANSTDGDIALPTGGPKPTASGFNPEQFLAMAWSTCLGETLRVVLAEHRLEHESSVRVEVELHRDPAGGFRFLPRALVAIDGLDPERARELAAAAHARCPVSKLLDGQGEPVVELVVEH